MHPGVLPSDRRASRCRVAAAATAPPAAAPPRVGRRRRHDHRSTSDGYGHGQGMSQYGATHRARADRPVRQILEFYYPGTELGTRPARSGCWSPPTPTATSGRVRARADGARTRRRQGLAARRSRPGPPRWRIMAGGRPPRDLVPDRGLARVAHGHGRRRVRRRQPADHAVHADGAAPYRGALRSAVGTGTGVDRQRAPLDTYVRGVVPREMPALWPQQALRPRRSPRAPTPRSSAAHASSTVYDLCDTSSCQVYGGYAASTRSDAAVDGHGRQDPDVRRRAGLRAVHAEQRRLDASPGVPVPRRGPADPFDRGPPATRRSTVHGARSGASGSIGDLTRSRSPVATATAHGGGHGARSTASRHATGLGDTSDRATRSPLASRAISAGLTWSMATLHHSCRMRRPRVAALVRRARRWPLAAPAPRDAGEDVAGPGRRGSRSRGTATGTATGCRSTAPRGPPARA